MPKKVRMKNPRPARLDDKDLAALGEFQKEYTLALRGFVRLAVAGSIVLALAFMVALVAIAIKQPPRREEDWFAAGIIFLIPLGMGASFPLYHHLFSVRSLRVFENGLSWVRRSRQFSALWEDVAIVRRVPVMNLPLLGFRFDVQLELAGKPGVAVQLSHRSRDVDELADLIESRTQSSVVERSLASIEAYGRLDLGPISLDAAGISYDSEVLPWQQVAGCRRFERVFQILKKGAATPWLSLPGDRIPNTRACGSLIEKAAGVGLGAAVTGSPSQSPTARTVRPFPPQHGRSRWWWRLRERQRRVLSLGGLLTIGVGFVAGSWAIKKATAVEPFPGSARLNAAFGKAMEDILADPELRRKAKLLANSPGTTAHSSSGIAEQLSDRGLALLPVNALLEFADLRLAMAEQSESFCTRLWKGGASRADVQSALERLPDRQLRRFFELSAEGVRLSLRAPARVPPIKGSSVSAAITAAGDTLPAPEKQRFLRAIELGERASDNDGCLVLQVLIKTAKSLPAERARDLLLALQLPDSVDWQH